jgi:predicted dehydrogenase
LKQPIFGAMRKFALIGCGRIAERHAENICRVGKLAAVCDVVQEKRAAFAEKYNAKTYESIEDLLALENEVDIVAICTPNGFHAEHTIKALQARKHVLCEQPLCLTTAAAWQIIETEKFCGRKLFLVASTRYSPLVKQIKEYLSNGKLGTVYSFHLSCLWNRPDEYYQEWRGKLFPDGGTLYTEFNHYIEAMLLLFGEVVNVKGFSENAAHQQSVEFEDTGTVALQMQTGALGTFHWSVNAFRKNHEIALTIIAAKGTVRIGGEYLQEIQYSETENNLAFTSPERSANGENFYNESMIRYNQVYDEIIQSLDHPGRQVTGAFGGLKTVETIDKIYKAVSQL